MCLPLEATGRFGGLTPRSAEESFPLLQLPLQLFRRQIVPPADARAQLQGGTVRPPPAVPPPASVRAGKAALGTEPGWTSAVRGGKGQEGEHLCRPEL